MSLLWNQSFFKIMVKNYQQVFILICIVEFGFTQMKADRLNLHICCYCVILSLCFNLKGFDLFLLFYFKLCKETNK